MMKFGVAGMVVAGLYAALLGLIPTAQAAPVNTQSAAELVQRLQADGYSVQINGFPGASEPLSQCIVKDASGLPATPGPTDSGGTVYVTVSCAHHED